jgi:hypothetical protein
LKTPSILFKQFNFTPKDAVVASQLLMCFYSTGNIYEIHLGMVQKRLPTLIGLTQLCGQPTILDLSLIGHQLET